MKKQTIKVTYTICKIRRGTSKRKHIIHAEVRDNNDRFCVGATLEYCCQWITEKLLIGERHANEDDSN